MKHWMWFVCLAFLVAFSLSAVAATRDLVFEEEEAASVPQDAGIPADEVQAVVKVKAQIELTRDGKTEVVEPDMKFKSGDKVRIVYTPYVDAYVYWIGFGSTGKEVMLFPNEKTGLDNLVKKNTTYTIPVKGSFKFDENAGEENLMLIMTPDKDTELEALAKDNAVEGGKIQTARKEAEETQEKASATRDLVFEEEKDEETKVETRTQVSKDIKQPFISVWTLVHE